MRFLNVCGYLAMNPLLQAPRPTATLQLCVPDHPNGTIQETTVQTQNNPNPASTSGASSDNLQQQQSCSVWGTAFIFHLCTMRGHPSTIRGRPSTPSSSLASSSLPGGTLAKGADIGVEHADEDSKGQKRHHRNPTAAAYLPDSLVRVLLNPDILLVGVGVGGDVSRLEREYEQLRASGVRGVVDLSEVAKRKVRVRDSPLVFASVRALASDSAIEFINRQLKRPSRVLPETRGNVTIWFSCTVYRSVVLLRSDGLRQDFSVSTSMKLLWKHEATQYTTSSITQ